jgi:hypothetical protein
MYITCRVCGKIKPFKSDIELMNIASIKQSIVNEAVENVFTVYDVMGGDNSVAKGREFVKETLEIIKENITTSA